MFWDLKKTLDQETNFMMYEPLERTYDEESISQIEKNITLANEEIDFLKIAFSDDKMVGYLSAERGCFSRNRHTAYLTTGILKDYSRKGIAKNLFVLLDYWAKNNGIERIELTVLSDNQRAIDLYNRNNFIIEGTRKGSMKIDKVNKDELFMAKYYQ